MVVVIGMLVIVIVVFIRVHVAAGSKDLNASRRVNQIAAFARAFHRVQQSFFPARAVYQDQIGFGNRNEITRRRHEPVLIGADRHQRNHLRVITGHIARHISQDAVHRHDMQLIATCE